MPNDTYMVGVGSTSTHKRGGLLDALERKGHLLSEGTPQLVIVDALSGVPRQPFGQNEGIRGAENRCFHTIRTHQDLEFAVGVESFVDVGRTKAFEQTAIFLGRRNDRREKAGWVVTLSVAIEVPHDLAEKALRSGLPKPPTVGELIAEKFGGDPTDPIATLTKGRLTRRMVIADAIFAALVQLPD